MPVLGLFSKRANEVEAGGAIDLEGLARLLCPYRGEVTRFGLPYGALVLSSLAATGGTSARVFTIPSETRKNPQTAWLEIAVGDDGVSFQTDPLGMFPLWCFEDASRVIVTGEVKALLAVAGVRVAFRPDAFDSPRRPPDFSPYEGIRRVPPGAILRVSRGGDVTEHRRTPLVFRPTSMVVDAAEQAALLESVLVESARAIAPVPDGSSGPRGSMERWGTFLSGGVDSSIATSLLGRSRSDLRTFTLGTKLGDEYADAAALATHLGMPHTKVFATEADAIRYFEHAVFCNETVDGLTAETLAQLGILAVASAACSVSQIATGYGADLLFGSMLRHELYMKVTGVDDLQSLIERTCWSGEFAPFFAWALGVRIHHLFWDPAVMNTAFRIPPQASFDGEREKIVLREVACGQGGYMLREHAHRRKQALTDGTQFNQVLSTALDLSNRHAYGEKNERCIGQLRRLYDTGGPAA